jgi:galactokinase
MGAVTGFRRWCGLRPELLSFAPDGLVMSAALDRGIRLVAAPREDRRVRMASSLLGEAPEFSVRGEIEFDEKTPWTNYIKGVLAELKKAGIPLRGVDLWIDGDIPLGGGMSSSAALEVSAAHLFLALAGREMAPWDVAKLCQRAENQFVGVQCGILDQFSSVFGKAGHLLWLDCRSLDHGTCPAGDGIEVIVANSMVHHQLNDGGYNALRQSCERAVVHFQEKISAHTVEALRDVSFQEWEDFREGLSLEDQQRSRHVIEEIERVDQGRKALEDGDAEQLGRLMVESHNSSRDLFKNSCRELDLLVEIATACDGVLGAKLSGGGFGGCIVALAQSTVAADVAGRIRERFLEETQIRPEVSRCRIGDGAAVEKDL